MDPRQIVMIVSVSLVAVVVLTKLVIDAVIRWREVSAAKPSSEIERRLERMELALESIAVEVERTGEAQRFAARLSPPVPDATQARAIRMTTPH